ncbi:hypothetical protein RRF57_009315 [Xylaria bambusicola]|uniref:Uncharacterized protein n=1 Tax=Xylaria bambusicola TaxID=326684 RepID=A0AAN7UVC1_9PEZI
MSLNPFFDCLDILATILQFLPDIRLVAVENVGRGRLVRTGVEHAPAPVLKTSTQVSGKCVLLRRLQVHVVGAGR